MVSTHDNPRRGHVLAVLLFEIGLVCAISPSRASWEYIPLEVRMIEADVVVAGEIVKPGKSLKKHGQVYEVGIIRPIQLLKGSSGKNRQIRLAWPEIVPVLPAPQVGDKSIWVLRADESLPVFRATHLTDRQPLEKLAEVRERISTIDSIQWSKPKDGLQIGIFTEQRDLRDATIQKAGQTVEAVARLSIYPLLKNVSEKSIYVNMFRYDMPFSILCFEPNGRAMDVSTYDTAPSEPSPPARQHFIHIPPGRVRSSPHGFVLPILTEGGEYSIRMRYKSYREAPDLELDNIWKGAMASPTIAVQVPGRGGRGW